LKGDEAGEVLTDHAVSISSADRSGLKAGVVTFNYAGVMEFQYPLRIEAG